MVKVMNEADCEQRTTHKTGGVVHLADPRKKARLNPGLVCHQRRRVITEANYVSK